MEINHTFSEKELVGGDLHLSYHHRDPVHSVTYDATDGGNLFDHHGTVVVGVCAAYLWFGWVYLWIAIHGYFVRNRFL